MNKASTLPGRDFTLLLARCLLALLFVLYGWQKLNGFSGTVSYMAQLGLPLPTLAAIIAVVAEFIVGLAIATGLFTRPLALVLAAYTLATALIGHHYWTLDGAARHAAEINFYKNISIIGGLLALHASGPGRLALDRLLGRA